MPKQENIEVEAVVISNNRNNFIIELDNGHQMKAKLSGNMSRFNIRVMEGQRVMVSVSPYSMERGIITKRFDDENYQSSYGNQRRNRGQKQAIKKQNSRKKK